MGTYSYFVKTICWAHEFQVPEKSYNIRPWSYIRDFLPVHKTMVLQTGGLMCSGKKTVRLLWLSSCLRGVSSNPPPPPKHFNYALSPVVPWDTTWYWGNEGYTSQDGRRIELSILYCFTFLTPIESSSPG